MLLSDYLMLRNQQINVVTGGNSSIDSEKKADTPTNEAGLTFAEALSKQLETSKGVDFSNHALKRIDSRSIDMMGKLERLNRGVEMAAEKGSSDALVLVDSTAFLVSVKNNRVITTMANEDLKGNIFTNIDSTVIV